jgi:DNA-directed RNA polymerase II subunit RPB1
MLLEKNITMLDIKSQFCRRWARRFEDSKKLKSIKKNVLTKVTNCTILSNYDNSPQPIIHIRVEMVNYEYATIQMLTDFLLNFKLRGVSGIHTIEDVDKEKHKEFDNDGKEVDNEKYMITVGGVNLMGIRYINGIDYDKILCNDIVQIYETYGIHAARSAIAREIKTVIDNSGSSVNAAHLLLLNDVMTNTGELTAVNRFGINKLDTDPFSRASFEQTVDQFTQAAVFNEIDYMRSVSACIIGGKPFIGGTNICDLLLDTDAVVNMDMEGHEESENKHLKISDFTNNSLLDNLMQDSKPKK